MLNLTATGALIQREACSIQTKYSLSAALLLQVGITLDHEINGLLAELENLIVDSIYKLDLKRPKKSMTRNGMLNSDMLALLNALDTRTLLGINQEKYFALMITQVYAYKGIEPDEDDFDELLTEIFGKE